jgi:arsenate reductase
VKPSNTASRPAPEAVPAIATSGCLAYNVLFLCTGNSARSIMAEAILNKIGAGKFRAHSAGSKPRGSLHPETLRLLKSMRYNIFDYRSKSWAEFIGPEAPEFDFVFTVCDNAVAEACPAWPGQPITAHWGIPDPAEATGTPAEVSLAFKDAYQLLNQRIGTFVPLPLHSLSKLVIESKLREIGRMEGATARATEEA